MHPTADELSALRHELHELLRDRRVVVMGVGNDARGDDGFGVRVAERIDDQIAATVFVTFDLPEDYAVKAADLGPDIVLVLDAADFGGEPGQARLIRAEEIPPTPGVTHRPSLEMLARFLKLDAGAETWVLGVQPHLERVGLGDEMSQPVGRAVEELAPMLVELLSSDPVPADE
ncbi:MAG: hydrogenase maturation protease [Armatimonadota bacterium]|nr:hydrogenase maturation protease [Armatimonadota bacterium]